MKMKNTLLLTLLLLLAAVSNAQSLVIGEKPTDLKIKEYVIGTPVQSNTPLLIEFFVSFSEPSRATIPLLNELAGEYAGKLNVLLITRENRPDVEAFFAGKEYKFSVALDDQGKTFTGYGVQFVPFAVLLDARGRVVWFGHSSDLTRDVIRGVIK